MKINKRIPTLLGVVTALSLVILPLGAWTTAKAEELGEPVAMSADYGVQPLYGGTDSYTFHINGNEVKVDVLAENWVWPAIDQAVINIYSDAYNTYYGFKLKFIWTNKKGKETTWLNPSQYKPAEKEPMKLLESNNGLYKEHIEKNCNGKNMTGSPGSGWSCDHIYLTFSCRIGDSSVYTHEFGPIYF